MILCILLLFVTSINVSESEDWLEERRCLKYKIDRGIQTREIDVTTWAIEVLQYNISQINSVSKIYKQLELLSATPYGHAKLRNLTIKRTKARLTAITTGGNYIPYMNISVGSFVQKPAIVIVGGVRGCDWLGIAAAVNLIQELIINYDKNYYYTNLITWIVVPLLNPDGYNATLSDKNMRNWAKNMGRNDTSVDEFERAQDSKCFGVNLCNNFEYQWINYNYSNASWCDANYADRPFSQNEALALRDTIRDHLDTVKIFVSIKQIRRALTYPFSYTTEKPLFWQVFENIVKQAAKVASLRHGRHFDYGHVLKFEKRYAGDVDDWIKAHFGVLPSFTFAVSDWKDNREVPSREEIRRTNQEVCDALKIIATMGMKFDGKRYLPLEQDVNCKRSFLGDVSIILVAVILPQINKFIF